MCILSCWLKCFVAAAFVISFYYILTDFYILVDVSTLPEKNMYKIYFHFGVTNSVLATEALHDLHF